MLGTNIPIMLYTVPAVTGILFLIPAVEFSPKWAFLCFFVTAVMSFILPTEREALVMFAGLLGYYPILKIIIERLSSPIFGGAIKFVTFNAALTLCFLVITKTLGLPIFESQRLSATVVTVVAFAVGNAVFVLYDIALTRLLNAYFIRFRKVVRKTLRLK